MKRKKTSSHGSLKRKPDLQDVDSAAQTDASALHEPVLLNECLQYLEPQTGGVFVDCTLGMGGHSEAILNSSPDANVIGFDRDAEAIAKASERLKVFGNRFRAIHADYKTLKTVLQTVGVEKVNGILADLGVSSWQLDAPERGFSFRFDAPLDMRMNQTSDEPTAAELLATLPEEAIANLIYEYGEERFSRRIARRIIERRENGEAVATTKQLADLVAGAVRIGGKHERIHPATRTFQALRIAVNKELEGLNDFLTNAVEVLEAGGKFAVISFHSLEDRIVKREFRRLAGVCECPPRLPICQCGAVKKVEILTNRPAVAGDDEMMRNPRARSAKLRVCRRLAE